MAGGAKMTAPSDIKKPEYKNDELIDNVEGLKNEAKTEYTQDTDNAKTNANKVKLGAYREDVNNLNEQQKANQAKGQGQYGMFNNKDYSTTLKLARQANAYNTRPRSQIMSVGTRNTGGVQSLGYGYDKPELNTHEQQAVQQTLGLDTNQKQLAQQLQAAVNSKNLEAFKQAVSQAFQVNLTDYNAKIAMDTLSRQMEMQDITSKNLMQFKDLWERWFGADTAATLYNTVAENETFGQQLSAILTGQAAPSVTDQFSSEYMNNYMKQHINGAKADPIRTWNDGLAELKTIGIDYNVQATAIQITRDNWFTRLGAVIKEAGK